MSDRQFFPSRLAEAAAKDITCGSTVSNRTSRLKFSNNVAQLRVNPPAIAAAPDLRDLRKLLWSSIDNDTSRDLDQIEFAERLSNGDVKVLIGIADLDAFVPKGSPIDQHAAKETTTVYAGVRNFPMLPEELSTGKTSLLENQDRLSVVVEFVVDGDGQIKSSDIYRALVRNQAQLQYNSVGAWLEGTTAAPPKVAASADLQRRNCVCRTEVAQEAEDRSRRRFENGARPISRLMNSVRFWWTIE